MCTLQPCASGSAVICMLFALTLWAAGCSSLFFACLIFHTKMRLVPCPWPPRDVWFCAIYSSTSGAHCCASPLTCGVFMASISAVLLYLRHIMAWHSTAGTCACMLASGVFTGSAKNPTRHVLVLANSARYVGCVLSGKGLSVVLGEGQSRV